MSPLLPWDSPFLLAPMAGLTTTGVRALFHQWGAGATSTGLLDAQGLASDREGSRRRAIASSPQQILQLFGDSPRDVLRAASGAADLGFAGVELNLGCPSPVLLKRGCGAAMMSNLPAILQVLEALRDATDLPVGLKCRTGLRQGDHLFLKVYQAAVQTRMDWFALHPRSLREGYSATPHWDLLKMLPEDGPLLITGGSLQTADQVREVMASYPNVQACYIGRPAFLRTWIFEDLKGMATPDYPEMADRALSVLAELASDLDQREAARILSYMMRTLGLEPSRTPQLDLIQPQLRRGMHAAIEKRYRHSPFPEIKGNPFLRSS